MAEYVSFSEVCAKVAFKAVLDHWNIPYSETREGLKGQTDKFPFVINTSKNLFIAPGKEFKGSPINFLSVLEDISLREAALKLKHKFLADQPKEEKTIPDLELDYEHKAVEALGISPEEAKVFNVGYCGKGIMKGRVAFEIRDKDGQKVGYVGRATRDGQKPLYLFPKGFKQEHIYKLHGLVDNKWAILAPDPVDCIFIHRHFPNRALALLSLNMTEEQKFLLSQIKLIYLLHPSGDNIALRLVKNCLVKSPNLPKAVRHLSQEEIQNLLK